MAFIAAFTCTGIRRIGREVGFPLAVIAATADPIAHAAWLTATAHGAWLAGAGPDDHAFHDDSVSGDVEFEYGMLAFEPRWLGADALPSGIAMIGGALAVALPPGVADGDVSTLLWSGLFDATLGITARDPRTVRHRLERGGPAVVPPRYALAAPGAVGDVVPVDDLFRFRPRDLRLLVDTVDLVLGSLGAAYAPQAVPQDLGCVPVRR